MELTNAEARGQVCTYGLPVAIDLRNTKERATEHKEMKGSKKKYRRGNKVKRQTRKTCHAV